MNINTEIHYINGEWHTSNSDEYLNVVNPASETVIARISAGDDSDIEAATLAAKNAFENGPWPKMNGAERAEYLRKFAQAITDELPFLASLEVQDNGKPLAEAVWDIEDTAACFSFYAELAQELDENSEEQIALSDERFTSKAVKEPVGAVGAIIPWNFPMLMAAWKVAPALAAGCTIVLKPSEVTPLTALALAKIADDIELPKGVLNVVTGLGHTVGQALTKSPHIDKLAFTGSVPTGSKVMQEAARDIKNISLELGGKSPIIVFDDCNLEQAVEWIMFGIFWNQGQVCSGTSRALVHQSVYPKLLERLVEEANKVSIGPGDQQDVLMGPLVNAAQYKKVLDAVKRGVDEGAVLQCGGRRPDHLTVGYYVAPTVLTDMQEDSWVWNEEIFGPVLCIKTFETESEAIRMANNSRFGLAAAVMSTDDDRCDRVAAALRAGIVWINCSQPTFVEAPWGGYKQSGIGRELGKWGLNNYLETKQITRFDANEPWGWYIK